MNRRWLVLWSGLLLSGQIYALVQRITLEEAERRFRESNLQLLAAKLEIDASGAAALQAGVWQNPSLQIDQNIYNQFTKKYFDFTKSGETEIYVQQLVSLAGKFSKRFHAANKRTEVSKNDYFDLMRALKRQLRTTFFSLFFKLESLNAYDRSLALISQTVTSAEKLFASHSILQSELLRLKALQLSLQTERLTLASQIRDLRGDLRVLLKEPAESEARLEPQPDLQRLESLRLTIGLQEAFEIARKNRPDYQRAQNLLAFEQLNLSAQKAVAWPDLKLAFHYDRAGNYIPEYYALNLSVDIPLFDRNQGNIGQARINTEKQARLLELARQTFESEVRQAFSKVQDIEDQYRKLDKDIIPNYDSLAKKMVHNYQARNIGIMAFADFFQSYRSSLSQLNELYANRLSAFEELNYAVGTDLIQISHP